MNDCKLIKVSFGVIRTPAACSRFLHLSQRAVADEWEAEFSQLLSARPALEGAAAVSSGMVDCRRHQAASTPSASAAAALVSAPLLSKPVPAELPGGGIAAALSVACMRLHRFHRENSEGSAVARSASAWVLVLSASTTRSRQHSAVVNCAFSAQRMQAPIDVCSLREPCSVLQQACHVTGGTFSSPTAAQQASLSTFLQTVHMVPPALRKAMKQLPQTSVDLRVACSESGDLLEMAFVCTACLAAFKSARDKCSTCGAKYRTVEEGAT